MKATIVGAGISGLTAAHILQTGGYDVTIFDTKPYLGGACSVTTLAGCTIPMHGPHIFHTDDKFVFKLVSELASSLQFYNHYVNALTDSFGTVPIPYSDCSAELTGPIPDSKIIEQFFDTYSYKMWGKKFTELPEDITKRIPIRRKGVDLRYFTSKYQLLPDYESLFDGLAHKCTLALGVHGDEWRKFQHDVLVYTGSIDDFYKSDEKLPYRTLDITGVTQNPVNMVGAVLNDCRLGTKTTRFTDYSAFPGSNSRVYTIETPGDHVHGVTEPYYPIPFGSAQKAANKLKSIPVADDTVFIGRLGTYKYIDMDKAMTLAIDSLEKFVPYKKLRGLDDANSN